MRIPSYTSSNEIHINLFISCERCKARKVKCDRVDPTCGWCSRQNRECVYKEKQKPGFQVVHKLSRLETLLEDISGRFEKHLTEHGDLCHSEQAVRMPSQCSEFRDLEENYDQPLSASIISQDTPEFDLTWSGSNFNDRSRDFDSDVDISVQSIVDKAGQELIEQAEAGSSSTCFSNPTIAPRMNDYEILPYDLLYTLVDTYFKHVNSWCPILYRKATVDAFFGSHTMGEPDRILLHAIIVTTLRFSKDPRLTLESRTRFYKMSKQKVLLYVTGHPDVRALQALIILAVDMLGTSSGQQDCGLLALIARNIVQLGLDVERSSYLELSSYSPTTMLQAPQPKSWVEDEERRRLCWMTFILDRYATIETTDNFVLDERKMDRSLPCRYDLFSQNEPVKTRWYRYAGSPETIVNRPENLGSFSYHCEILLILSRIQRFLHCPLDITSHSDIQRWREMSSDFDEELIRWLQSLPDEYSKMSELCHPDPGSRISNWITLHAAFVISVIRLHSPAAFPTIHSLIFVPTDYALRRCLTAVDSLRVITQEVLHSNVLTLLGHPFAFTLWVSARLLIVHAATVESGVNAQINFFITTLEQMGRNWQVAQGYAQDLRDVVQEGNSDTGRTYATMRRYVSDRPSLNQQPLRKKDLHMNYIYFHPTAPKRLSDH